MNVRGIWKGTVGVRNGKTVLTRSFHKWPLKIAKPFAGEHGELLLYLQDASPGLFNGDVQEIACTLEKGARLFLTTPASCRLHPSPTEEASRQLLRFFLQEGAVLEYFPEPLVPYRGVNFSGKTELHMEKGAQAMIAEILTPGRIGRGEIFAYERVASEFSVYWHGRLTAWDSLVLEPARWDTRHGIFDEYTHLATFWVLSEKTAPSHVEKLQSFFETFSTDEKYGARDVYAGASLLAENGLVVRMLGHSVCALQECIHASWRFLRRELLGSEPFPIRK
ncbi:hypothetical protein BSNK01_22170 [Bacillaceae bacterium]